MISVSNMKNKNCASDFHTHTLSDLAEHISAKIIGDGQLIISQLAPITRAQSGDLTYLTGKAYLKYLPDTKASAVIVTEEDAVNCPVTALIVPNPEYAFACIAALFNTVKKPIAGIHPSAVISKSASIDPTVFIGACCVIGDNVVIAANTIIHAGSIIQEGVTIGSDCLIYPKVTLHHQITLGNRVILHSGVVIGADGFGLVMHKGSWEKIPQLGSVVIGDDVEVGANTCIDRGALDNTIIHNGVKIDNLVQIAHNVVVGSHTVIAGCAGIAGSTTIGQYCMIGGSANVAGHLTIADHVIFTGMAMATKSISEPGIYSSGTGILPNKLWAKMVAKLRRTV